MTKATENEINPFREISDLRSEPLSLPSLIAPNERIPTGLSDIARQRIEDQFLPSLVIDMGTVPAGERVPPAHNDNDKLDRREDERQAPRFEAIAAAAREVAGIIRGSSGMLSREQTGRLDELLNQQFDEAERNPQNLSVLRNSLNSNLRDTPYRVNLTQEVGLTVAEFQHRQESADPSDGPVTNWRTFHVLDHWHKEVVEREQRLRAVMADSQTLANNVRGTNGMLDADNIRTIDRIVRERHASSYPHAISSLRAFTNGRLADTQYRLQVDEDANFRPLAVHILHNGGKVHSIDLGR